MSVDYNKLTPDELRWRGRSDARALAEAEAVKMDKARLANAQKEAKNIFEEQQSELRGIAKVVGARTKTSTPDPNQNSNQKVRNTMVNERNLIEGFPTSPKF